MTRQELPPDILPSEIKEEDMPAHIAMIINKQNREVHRLDRRIDGAKMEITTMGEIMQEGFGNNAKDHTNFASKHDDTMKVISSMADDMKGIRTSFDTFVSKMQPTIKEKEDIKGFWAIVNKYKTWIGLALIPVFASFNWFWSTILSPIIELGLKAWLGN